MKLTKKKLEQLIMEEMRYFRPAPYDPRAEKEYPEHADKLTKIAMSGPEGYQQAMELSDALGDEPIDFPVPEEPDDDWQFWRAPYLTRSEEYRKMMSGPWQAAKKHFYDWAQTQPQFKKLNGRPGPRSIFQLPKPQRYEELKNFLRDTGDQESYEVMKRTMNRTHMSTYLNNDEVNYNKNVFMKESTEQQKIQQRKDNWDARDRLRKQTKVKIKKAQAKDPAESPYKNERPDFDPIKDLGKALKKRHKDLEVRANGEEIED